MNKRVQHKRKRRVSIAERIEKKLDKIINKLNDMANTIQELTAKVDAAQVELDRIQAILATKQAQDAATIATLEQTVADLRAEGGTEEARQTMADKLEALVVDIKSTAAETPAPTE